MKHFIQFNISFSSAEKYDVAIAMLSSMGIEGFEEIENGLIATASKERVDENEIVGWLQVEDITFTKTYLEDQNWNEVWERNYQPIIVDDFVGIRASFHPSQLGVQYDLEITPKMSFGTGHHATTHQMIQLMRELPFAGSTVFDFGTGTGLLAILADKMGAKSVEAIDNDEWSILNATENCIANQALKVKIRKAENLVGVSTADIILANINKSIILHFLPELVGLVHEGGCLVLSGLLISDEEEIDLALKRLNFFIAFRTEMNGWIALVSKKR